jgi:putative heme iron utilization protein
MPNDPNKPRTSNRLRKKVRARMAETGEKYTQALRRIQEEERGDDGGVGTDPRVS